MCVLMTLITFCSRCEGLEGKQVGAWKGLVLGSSIAGAQSFNATSFAVPVYPFFLSVLMWACRAMLML